MKKLIFTIVSLITFTAMAQDIKLPEPNLTQKSISVIEALKTRHSVRSFADKELSIQQISDLCWAACGVTRDADHRTSPTARNKQEIRLYVFTKKGVYEYDAAKNILIQKSNQDKRSLVAGTKEFKQDFVLEAPISLVMVIDFDKLGGDDARSMQMGCVDAGNVSENINLYCQAVGLATVPRATMDSEGIKALLKLGAKHHPIMNNPVGYEKKIG